MTHGTSIAICRRRRGSIRCWRIRRRSGESSEPSRTFSAAEIEMKASHSSQARSRSGAGFASSSSGASRANGPPIISQASCRIG